MNAAKQFMWTDVIFIHIVRSSAVVSLVDTMEISGEVNQLPWQPIQPVTSRLAGEALGNSLVQFADNICSDMPRDSS